MSRAYLPLFTLLLPLISCGNDAQSPTAVEAKGVQSLVAGSTKNATVGIHPQISGAKCIDVRSGSNDDGTPVQIYSCTDGRVQSWLRDGSHYQVFANKCLDVKDGVAANGTRLQIWTCSDNNPNQDFTVEGTTVRWTKNPKYCLDLTDGNTANGTPLQLWTCNEGNNNQSWGFTTDAPAAATTAAANSDDRPQSGLPSALDVSPYFFTWANNNKSYAISTPLDALNQAKMKSMHVAFGLSSGGCALTNDISSMAANIRSFVTAGGRAILSFGGADGLYLQEGCSDPSKVASLLQGALTQTKAANLDFDIEGAHLNNTRANQTLVAALKIVQKNIPGIYISYTLPVSPSGLEGNSKKLLTMTRDAGINLSRVNIMTMDYGKGNCSSQSDCAISSAEGTVAQLRSIFGDLKDSTVYRLLGMTALIGVQDDGTTFSLSHARSVAAYAKSKGVGMLSFWGMQRDRADRGDAGNHSNAQDTDFAFMRSFQAAQ